MSCKITTTWCQSEKRCSAKVVKNGNSFIDPPVSSLFPSNGAVYNLECPLGTSSTVSTTVNWVFSYGQWHWDYNCNGVSIPYKTYDAKRIQPTTLQRICQNFSVCYKSEGECPGGAPLGTTPPGEFNDYSNWSSAVESQANALGSGGPSTTLPSLPITLSSESTTTVSNTGPGSSPPNSTTSSGAQANCHSFDNPVKTSEYPTSAPTTDSSNGPDLEALN